MDPVICWKLAKADPARALRGLDALPKTGRLPLHHFYLALGARARDESISRQAFMTALQGLDRMIEEEPSAGGPKPYRF